MWKPLILLIFWLHYAIALGNLSTSLTAKSVRRQPEKYGQINILMKDLQNQEWDQDEALCVELLTKIMINVKNSTLWATWIWDSMQNPVGQLYGSKNNYGNYDECVEFPWKKVHPDMRTQYCMTYIHLSQVDLKIDDVDFFGNVNNYIRAKTKHHLKFNSLRWGVCTPVACKPHSVTKFVNVLFKQTHLGLAVDKHNISVIKCYNAEDKADSYGFGYYFTISFIIFFILFTFLATWIISTNKSNETYGDIIKAFHIPRNLQSLIKVADNDIRCFFGIRAITCCIVMGMHVFWIMKVGSISNALRLDKDYRPIITGLFSLEMVVDTFLFMSGFLLVKSVLADGLEKFNFVKLIVKRYMRITWLLSLVILCVVNVLHDAARGPTVKEVYTSEIDACRQNWLASLLLIQNYYDTGNMCHAVEWSTNVDFHLSVLGTFMCWVFLKNKRAGLLLFMISFMFSILIPAAFVYTDFRHYHPLFVDFRLTDDYRETVFKNEPYIASHFRAGSYLVGMSVGYIMLKYNPVVRRNVIGKVYSILGFSVVMLMFLGVFLIGDIMFYREYTPLEVALFLSLKRIIWAVLVGILVIICEYGTLPFVNSFLGWLVWAPMSKLSYGSYLVHPIIVYYSVSTARNPDQYDVLGIVLNTFGSFVLSNIVSLFLWIFFDAPMQNIISLVCRSKNKKVDEDVIKDTNREEIHSDRDVMEKKII